MKKKKRIEEIRLARLRELLIAAIRERSGKVVSFPSASVMPIALKNILKIFLMILTVFFFLFSLLNVDVWFQELVTHPFISSYRNKLSLIRSLELSSSF